MTDGVPPQAMADVGELDVRRGGIFGRGHSVHLWCACGSRAPAPLPPRQAHGTKRWWVASGGTDNERVRMGAAWYTLAMVMDGLGVRGARHAG
jgi:hypothetical protein